MKRYTSAMTVKFGAIENPLAGAQGPDQSRDPEKP